MKILVICQYYHPEPFRLNDVCEELVRLGHEVTVVTGTPNYPEGEIYPGYEKGARKDETLNGVRVRRCRLIPRKTGNLRRLMNYFSFPISAKRFVLGKECAPEAGGDFDVVFVNQLSPVMMAEPGLRYGKKRGVPVVLYCLDLWPESVVAGGLRRGGFPFKVFSHISQKIYRRADRVLVANRTFAGYLTEKTGVSPDKIAFLPQYAENVFGYSDPREPDGTVNLTFAGNVGAAQDLDTVIKAAALTRALPVTYHIVGGGTELDRLRALAEENGADNVVFHGRLPLSEMPELYRTSDAMLVTMRDDPELNMTLPGKVQSYMAAGRPVIGAINGEAARVISEADCGYVSPAGDAAALAENVGRFCAGEATETLRMGKAAREYYEKHFDKSIFMKKLTEELLSAAENRK
ncbi:MAG: glycosyltransferase family 4 protein [Clostridia bacterium]|nr:glycosyltransferase family 4 protein [Clostridia bacterium]